MRDTSGARDDGATLRGLLFVVGAVLTLVAVIVVVYAGVARTRATAGDRDLAQEQLTVMGQSLIDSLADASDARVRLDGHALVARVAIGDEGYECRAWFLDDDGLHYLATDDPIDLDAGSTWPVIAPGALGALPGNAAFRQFAGVVRVSAGVEVGEVVIPFVTIASPPGSEEAHQC